MKTKTNVKAGIVKLLDAATPKLFNHNQTQVRTTNPAAGLRVKTSVKAGRTLTPQVPTGMVIKWG